MLKLMRWRLVIQLLFDFPCVDNTQWVQWSQLKKDKSTIYKRSCQIKYFGFTHFLDFNTKNDNIKNKKDTVYFIVCFIGTFQLILHV
jgi:hypothetical protein